MRKIAFAPLTKKLRLAWEKEKRREWKGNADFWIHVIQKGLDPFRTQVTYPAILKALPEKRGLYVLDAGCGEGSLARSMARKSLRVTGIDSSPELISAAKALEKQQKAGISYTVADMRKTKLPASSFDILVSHQSIMELPNPEKALKEFSRVLKKKGKLILLFLHPCFDFPEDSGERYFRRGKIQKEYYLVSGIKSPLFYFYLHLPLEEWISLLKKGGLSLQNITEPHPPQKLFRQRWWKEHFRKPRFILLEAEKK